METGILYVVFNESIRDPKTNEKLFKISTTKKSTSDRYYELDLEMPGKFETLFAYTLQDYEEVGQLIQRILKNYRRSGKWFKIGQKELDLIKLICETMGGILVTNENQTEIPGVNIKIKGIDVPLCKKTNETIQDFVRKIMRLMFNNKLIPDSEINRMLKKDYGKEAFGLGFPIIQNDKNKLHDNAGHSRYWLREVFGDEYYVCSQWWKPNEGEYQDKLADWINWIKEINSRN